MDAHKLPFADRSEISVRAVLVGESLNLKSIERGAQLATSPVVVPAGDNGAAALFRYGAVVFFHVGPVEQASFLNHLQHLLTERFSDAEVEELEIQVHPDHRESVGEGILHLQEIDLLRVQIVADVLARSVALAHYETAVAKVFDRVEPVALNMSLAPTHRRQIKDLLHHIASTLLIQHKMVGRVEVEEKPELLWDFPEHDRLYHRLAEEYELRERHRALERKLAVISRTAETMLGLLQNRLSLRVEWYIVLLIVVEILLMIWQMVFGG